MIEWKMMEEWLKIGKSGYDDRLFKENHKILNIKRKIGFTRENQIQILTQTPFFKPILGRVMLDSLRSQSST